MSIYGNSIGYPIPDPRKGLDMQGSIDMNGNAINGLNTPTKDNQPATKGYVDQTVNTLKNGYRKTYKITLYANAWSNNLQTVSIAEVTADETKTDVYCSADPADENYAAYTENNVRPYKQLNGAVQFKCADVPGINLTVNVAVFL